MLQRIYAEKGLLYFEGIQVYWIQQISAIKVVRNAHWDYVIE